MEKQSWGQQIRNNPNFFNEFKLNTNPVHGATFIPIDKPMGYKEPNKTVGLIGNRPFEDSNLSEDFSDNMSAEQYNESQSDFDIC